MSNGEIVDLTVRILKDIRSELQKGFAGVNKRLDQTNERLDLLTSRVENLRDIAGARARDHEVRIRRLESRLIAR